MSGSKTKRLIWIGAALAFASVVALATFHALRESFIAHGPGGDGVLGRVTTSSGCEVVLSQRWNREPFEPYTVALWLREPGEEWGWCYVGHQEHRWTESALEYDRERDEVRLLNAGVVRGRLDCSSLQFALYNERGNFKRSVTAPQELRAPDWQ